MIEGLDVDESPPLLCSMIQCWTPVHEDWLYCFNHGTPGGYIKGVGTDAMADGLHAKYRVTKIETGEEVTEPVFVIKFSDKYAVKALTAYAAACSDHYPQLARDILVKLGAGLDDRMEKERG